MYSFKSSSKIQSMFNMKISILIKFNTKKLNILKIEKWNETIFLNDNLLSKI